MATRLGPDLGGFAPMEGSSGGVLFNPDLGGYSFQGDVPQFGPVPDMAFSPVTADPYWKFLSLWLPGDRYVDIGPGKNGVVIRGSVPISTRVTKFWPGSYDFTAGSSNNSLIIPAGVGLVGAQDYDFEMWMYPTAGPGSGVNIGVVSAYLSGARAWDILMGNGGIANNALPNLVIVQATTDGVNDTGIYPATPQVIVPNRGWYHIRLTRKNGVAYGFVNGRRGAPVLDTRTYFNPQTMWVGAMPDNTQPFVGYLANIKLYIGVSRGFDEFPLPLNAGPLQTEPVTQTFVPTDLFRDGTLGGFWDFTDPNTLFTDTARTTPSGAGGQVRGVTDLSGNAWHLQCVSGTGITRFASAAGYGGINFPGTTNNFLQTQFGGATTIGSAAGWSSMAAWINNITGRADLVGCDFSTTGRISQCYDNFGTGGAASFGNGGASIQANGDVAVVGNPHVYGCHRTRGSHAVRVDGRTTVAGGLLGQNSTANTNSASATVAGANMQVGASFGGTTGPATLANAKLFAGLWINRPMTYEEIISCENWFAAHCNLGPIWN